MIYIFTAIYAEAEPLIRHFQMKKQEGKLPFQQFYSEEYQIHLTVTGVGKIAASVAVSAVCASRLEKTGDFFVNVGICAGEVKYRGQIFLCHKIIDAASGKTFYPDVLYRHPFAEAVVRTEDKVVAGQDIEGALKNDQETSQETSQETGHRLWDMESSGFYQAAAYFAPQQKILLLKIVSDGGADQKAHPAAQEVSEYVEKNIDEIIKFFDILKQAEQAEKRDEKEMDDRFVSLYQDFCCSETMRAQVKQFFKYLEVSDRAYREVLKDFYDNGLLPAKDKREGKRRFEEFRSRFI